MARTAVRRLAWLIYNGHSFDPNLLPSHSARTSAELSSLPAYFLVFNRRFCSTVKTSNSGNIKLRGKDQSHSELTALLKSYEFSQVQIDKIIQRYPKILLLRVSTNLKPKLDYLVECGFSGSVLCGVVTSNPFVFGYSLPFNIKPRYEFLRRYLDGKTNSVIMSNPWLFRCSNAETKVDYLENQGVPFSSISKLLGSAPSVLRYSKNRVVKLVEATRELGIETGDTMFVWYLRMFGTMSETSWKKKVEVLKSLGWSDEDVKATLLHYPQTLLLSEEKLRRNMDFYVSNVKAEPRDVIGQPILLGLSLNRRIIPRYEVMKLLREYNLLKSQKITTFFGRPEKQFIRSYIEKNLEQVPHLLQVYYDSRKAEADGTGLNS